MMLSSNPLHLETRVDYMDAAMFKEVMAIDEEREDPIARIKPSNQTKAR